VLCINDCVFTFLVRSFIMLEVLGRVEADLPHLLRDESLWNSLFIDYHPPTVERLWCSWGDYRISLHRIHPCDAGAALFHTHPWPSAMRILSGRYEMAVGRGKGSTPPPFACRIIASGDFRYEMTDRDAWHYVRPLDGPAMTVMVTGKPWDRASPKSDKPLRGLTAEQKADLLAFFRSEYPG
jgi:hypothetical protein